MRGKASDESAPGRHIQRNGKLGSSTNIFNKKCLVWRHVLILFSQIKRNWINNLDFLKFVIYSMRRQFLLPATEATKPSNATVGVLLLHFSFFFFFRRYNFISLNVLAFSTYNFHLFRSWTQIIQFFVFSFFISFIMSSSHLFFGLSSGRVKLRTGSFKLFKLPFPGVLTILTLQTLN